MITPWPIVDGRITGGPLVMGILNVTPDSFSDGGRYRDADAAILRGRALVADGADLIDVGGESTRPGAQAVDAHEELARVEPVIAALAKDAVISIDTCKAEVAARALAAGATIVNDVSAGLLDRELLSVVARSTATIVLGHLRGAPATMNEHAAYGDVVAEVVAELGARVEAARAAGIDRARIWIDPGLGFAKRAEHSLALLANLDALRSFGMPIVVGASRKSFLAGATGPDEREHATAAADAIAIWLGADVVRVHDVAAQRGAVRVAAALRAVRHASSLGRR